MSFSSANRRALHAVIATGTYAAAARSIGVSQPAVAQQIRDLERRCGAPLFVRQSGRLAPTPLCDELSALTERIEDLEAQAERLIVRRESASEGELRIGLGNSMPGMALIARFQKLYPSVSLSIVLGDHAQIIRAVLERRIDIGVLPTVPNDGRFLKEVLVEQEVIAIAHPDHPSTQADQTDCATLATLPLIFRSRGSSTQTVVDRAFRRAGLAPRARLVLDTRDGVYEAVANGLGIGFMWSHGTGRTDSIRRITINDIGPAHPEAVFRLTEARGALVEAFFSQAAAFRRDFSSALNQA